MFILPAIYPVKDGINLRNLRVAKCLARHPLMTGVLISMFGIFGISAVMAWGQGSSEVADTGPEQFQNEAVQRIGSKCAQCGVVETIRLAEVTVRMSDGASHLFVAANPAHWRRGERVIFIERSSNSDE